MFRILIAEDDPSTARLLGAIVKRAGYEPLTAADGVQALEMLDHNQIDLLLCDVMMPRMDGFTLTRTIQESGSMLPILMLTAKDMPQDKHTGFIVGTDDYMTKPPDRQELVLRIKALLRQCILVTRQKWRDKPLQFEAELAPCTYHGSEALVKEIWLNLLDNAAKFSPENGTISVTLHCEQGSQVVAVTDQGCGMDAETCRHIFEQFYQGDTSHRTQGNGLGLAMAQKIAALHGGAVTVDSRPGSGSCFTVVLK